MFFLCFTAAVAIALGGGRVRKGQVASNHRSQFEDAQLFITLWCAIEHHHKVYTYSNHNSQVKKEHSQFMKEMRIEKHLKSLIFSLLRDNNTK